MLKGRKVFTAEDELININAELDKERFGLLEQLDQVVEFQNALRDNNSTSDQIPKISDRNRRIELQASQANTEDYPSRKSQNNSFDIQDDELLQHRRRDFVEKPITLPTTVFGGAFTHSTKLLRQKSEIRIRERVDVDDIPNSLKNIGQDGVLRFLRAKVQVLSEQLEASQKDEKKLVEKIKELQSERERVSEDRDKWIQQANTTKNLLMKHEQHASNVVMQLQNVQAENSHLKRECEKLKKGLKQVTQTSGTNEVRLNRSLEEVERLKNSLRQAKQGEKETRESSKKRIEEFSAVVKKIEKQKLELLHAFKKQLIVIENLKKQKGLADVGKALKSIEDDFMEFLDWNPKKG